MDFRLNGFNGIKGDGVIRGWRENEKE